MTISSIVSILQTINWPGEFSTRGGGDVSESSVTVISERDTDQDAVPHCAELVSHCLLATGYQSAS